MNHLGALITPFVDGELSPARRAAVQAHLETCDGCRRLVLAERTARRCTRAAASPQASSALHDRLLAVPVTVGDGAPAAPPSPSGGFPRRAMTLGLGGGLAVVGLMVLTLVVLGTPRTVSAPTEATVQPMPATGSITMASLPLDSTPQSQDALAWMSAHGWAAPTAVPGGLRVSDVVVLADDAHSTLQVRMTGTAGEVQLLERVGRLDPDAVADLPAGRVGGHTAYEVDGWWVVESGDCVVAITADSPSTARQVIASMPAPSSSAGVVSRLAAGWDVLVTGD